MPETLLKVRNLNAWYGESYILHDLNLDVHRGEVVTLLGRNGSGKTTTLKTIMGMLKLHTGSVTFAGQDMLKLSSDEVARSGIALCPEERGIFASLSVEENLLLPPVLQAGGMTSDEIYQLFPILKERAASRGTHLSGGEQQMLAIARILRTGATLLLLDEPTEGLAPVIIEQIGSILSEIKKRGFTILLVEQNFYFASSIADRHYVIEEGHVIDEIKNTELEQNTEKLKNYLGI